MAASENNYFLRTLLNGCFCKAFPKIWLHAETLSQIMWNMLIMFAFFFNYRDVILRNYPISWNILITFSTNTRYLIFHSKAKVLLKMTFSFYFSQIATLSSSKKQILTPLCFSRILWDLKWELSHFLEKKYKYYSSIKKIHISWAVRIYRSRLILKQKIRF